VLRPGAHASESELAGHCRARLAGFKRPKRVVLLDALPRSHYGKVQRAGLKARLSRAPDEDEQAPGTG